MTSQKEGKNVSTSLMRLRVKAFGLHCNTRTDQQAGYEKSNCPGDENPNCSQRDLLAPDIRSLPRPNDAGPASTH
jgi:hypothetical protein